MTAPEEFEERLRAALHQAGDDVQPTPDGLDRLQSRLTVAGQAGHKRGVGLTLALAGVVALAALALPVVLRGSPDVALVEEPAMESPGVGAPPSSVTTQTQGPAIIIDGWRPVAGGRFGLTTLGGDLAGLEDVTSQGDVVVAVGEVALDRPNGPKLSVPSVVRSVDGGGELRADLQGDLEPAGEAIGPYQGLTEVVATSDGGFLALGEETVRGTDTSTFALRSADGRTWTREDAAALQSVGRVTDMTVDGDAIVAVGQAADGSGPVAALGGAEPGAWELSTLPRGDGASVVAVAAAGRDALVAVGQDESAGKLYAWHSEDSGRSWEQLPDAGGLDGRLIEAAAPTATGAAVALLRGDVLALWETTDGRTFTPGPVVDADPGVTRASAMADTPSGIVVVGYDYDGDGLGAPAVWTCHEERCTDSLLPPVGEPSSYEPPNAVTVVGDHLVAVGGMNSNVAWRTGTDPLPSPPPE